MLAEPVKHRQSDNAQSESEHHVVGAVGTVDQLPRQLAHYPHRKQCQEISHAVASMGEPLCNKQSEHREGNPTETSQGFK